MRFFLKKFHKSLMLIYFAATISFGSYLFMDAIPDQVYVRRGEKLTLPGNLPVSMVDDSGASGQAQATKTGSVSGQGMEQKSEGAVVRRDQFYEDTTVSCRLFGIIPLKEIKVSVVEDQKVYASGRLIGIYEQTAGVLVLKTAEIVCASGESEDPARGKVYPGDYLTAFNGQQLHSKEELVEKIAQNKDRPVTLTLYRGGVRKKVRISPAETADHQYYLGIWVKDDMAGIGTLSYYKEDGSFGALGHGIGDGETGGLLSVEDGRIYTMTLTGIQKGKSGVPGALEGMIYYGRDYNLGKVKSNSDMGIYGRLEKSRVRDFASGDKHYPVAYKQEITPGKAWILSEVSGKKEAYEISIKDISYQPRDENKGIRFVVTDERLLTLTGGIVQGMSGSPIIQDGRLIGAVTHVLVDSPEKGYGIFVETMLANEK